MGYAKVTLLGNLTRDPETRQAPNGKAVTTFGIAVNRKAGDDKNGNPRESVMFIDVSIWGPRGTAFAKYHKKGSLAFLAGDLVLDQWDDKTTGEKKSKHKVTAWEFEFVGGKRDGGESGQDGGSGAQMGVPMGSPDVEDTPF